MKKSRLLLVVALIFAPALQGCMILTTLLLERPVHKRVNLEGDCRPTRLYISTKPRPPLLVLVPCRLVDPQGIENQEWKFLPEPESYGVVECWRGGNSFLRRTRKAFADAAAEGSPPLRVTLRYSDDPEGGYLDGKLCIYRGEEEVALLKYGSFHFLRKFEESEWTPLCADNDVELPLRITESTRRPASAFTTTAYRVMLLPFAVAADIATLPVQILIYPALVNIGWR